jgi:excinuclease UvrABC helicase subunit UvrB
LGGVKDAIDQEGGSLQNGKGICACGLVQKTIKRDLGVEMGVPKEILFSEIKEPVQTAHEKAHEYPTQKDLEKKIREYERLMKQAAKEYNFEDAARYRDMHKYMGMEVNLDDQ